GIAGNTANLPYMTIFGGLILSYIDQAGAIGARRAVHKMGGPLPFVVTVAVNRVEVKQPVLVCDVVRFLTQGVKIGRSAIPLHGAGEAARGGETLQVTEAEVVYVGIAPHSPGRRPVPLLPGKG